MLLSFILSSSASLEQLPPLSTSQKRKIPLTKMALRLDHILNQYNCFKLTCITCNFISNKK